MTRRITLRDVREDDLPVFFEHQSDPEGYRMAHYPSKARDAFMAHWSKILAGDTGIERTVEVDGAVAGNLVSWVHDGEREIGYWIGREYWGSGVATEALHAFLAVLEERPLFAHVVQSNIGSIRVLEKCGFVLVDREELPENGVIELRYRLGPPSPGSG